MATKKPSAASRTVDMFSRENADVIETAQAVANAEAEAEKAERLPLEADADRLRDQAFKVQEWTTAAFGCCDADAAQYRMTRRGDVYYLEGLGYAKGVPHASSYTGVILHKKDLFNAATVIAAAARALREENK